MENKKLLASREDIQCLVDNFYAQVQKDELLAPIFAAVIHDWAAHLPTMYDFWDSLLFGTMSYQGNPFAKHIPLPINENHFNRWLEIFIQTVDNQFFGEKADEIKQRATSIAQVFSCQCLK
jgi:hemoglobin